MRKMVAREKTEMKIGHIEIVIFLNPTHILPSYATMFLMQSIFIFGLYLETV